jgi:hypothetical protein
MHLLSRLVIKGPFEVADQYARVCRRVEVKNEKLDRLSISEFRWVVFSLCPTPNSGNERWRNSHIHGVGTVSPWVSNPSDLESLDLGVTINGDNEKHGEKLELGVISKAVADRVSRDGGCSDEERQHS